MEIIAAFIGAIVAAIVTFWASHQTLRDSLDSKSGWREKLFTVASKYELTLDDAQTVRAALRLYIMNSWQELTIHVHRDAEEAVSNLMIETGSQGVAISDSADYVGQEDRFGELYPEVEQSEMIAITAYYPDTLDIEEVKADLTARLADLTDFGLETGRISLESQELAEVFLQ